MKTITIKEQSSDVMINNINISINKSFYFIVSPFFMRFKLCGIICIEIQVIIIIIIIIVIIIVVVIVVVVCTDNVDNCLNSNQDK